MNAVLALFAHWHVDLRHGRAPVYRAPTPRERERWHALWLLARGWSPAPVAAAVERAAHTVGGWVERFRPSGPAGLVCEQPGGSWHLRPSPH